MSSARILRRFIQGLSNIYGNTNNYTNDNYDSNTYNRDKQW